jgi:hypothetical protein
MASPPRWTVAADSAAAPASSDTVQASPQAPAQVPEIEPAPTAAPAPTPAPALTKKQKRALEKQWRAQEKKAQARNKKERAKHPAPEGSSVKEKLKAEKLAAKAAKPPKPPKPPKIADVDSLAAWNTGASWVMVRGGLAKSGETGASGGAAGVALGYQRFLTARWAVGLIAQGDLLGKFAGAAEVEYPITLELTRHFRWKTPVRPFLGVGGGAYLRKFFRSGTDFVKLHSGAYLAGGFNTPISKRSILGIDGRMQFVSGDRLVTNPAFGPESAQLMHYSLKLGWSLLF